MLLDKKYSTFKATLFIEKGTNWSEDKTDSITVICDDKVKKPAYELNKTSDPIEIEVDVSGVDNFKIIFADSRGIHIANAGFYQ